MTDLGRIRTHARTIVEGEGAEIEDAALVEAVARAIEHEYDRASDPFEGTIYGGDFRLLALAALSTIRKHQAGE